MAGRAGLVYGWGCLFKEDCSHVKRQVKRAQDETQTDWRGSSAATHLDCTGAQRGVAAAKLF
jgi:hypothetical protein